MEWKKLIFNLDRMTANNVLSTNIKHSMERREKKLLDNEILLGAVYVDPTNRILLSETETDKARIAVTKIAMRLNLSKHDGTQELISVPSTSSTSPSDDFQSYMQTMAKRRRVAGSDACTTSNFKERFTAALLDMERIEQLDTKATVLDSIKMYPAMVQEVALNLSALPPTQVSVVRLFSSLKIIKSDLRTCIKEDLLHAILFLKTNGF